MTHHHHQFALYVSQERMRCGKQSKERIEHVYLSVGFDAQVVLADADATSKACLATIACLCVKLFHLLWGLGVRSERIAWDADYEATSIL